MALSEAEVLKVCQEWAEDPQRMLKWRTHEFKLLLHLLRDKVHKPTGSPRSKDALQLKALDMFQKLLVSMDQIRTQIPVVCPSCGHKFTRE